jgi:hypothetical protein
VFLTVRTPAARDGKVGADLGHLFAAAKSVARSLAAPGSSSTRARARLEPRATSRACSMPSDPHQSGTVLTHRQLLSAVWGFGCSEPLDLLKPAISRLRQKLEDDRRTLA